MINFETAKKLKDAGFPQKSEWGTISIMDTLTGKDISERCKVPPLSEIIEACGERLRWIEYRSRKDIQPEHRWLAQARGEQITNPDGSKRTAKNIMSLASTVDEAVANLWLALNTKPK